MDKLTKEQIELGKLILGDEFDTIAKDAQSLSEALEKNTRFKALKTKTNNDIVDVLSAMPPELISEQLLTKLQTFINRNLKSQKEMALKRYANTPGQDIFFSSNPANVRTKVKQTNDFSILNFTKGK